MTDLQTRINAEVAVKSAININQFKMALSKIFTDHANELIEKAKSSDSHTRIEQNCMAVAYQEAALVLMQLELLP